jgi:hypothetical protein
MKLMEEAPHVNRIVKTLIDEYAFVMNVRFTLTLRCMASAKLRLCQLPPLSILHNRRQTYRCASWRRTRGGPSGDLETKKAREPGAIPSAPP